MADSASGSASNPTPLTVAGAASSSTSPPLPPLLSRLSSPRAALPSVSAVSVSGSSSGAPAPATSARASLSKRDESMLRVVRRADSVTSATVTSTSATTPSTVTASAASPRDAPTSSVSSLSLPVHGEPPGLDVVGAAPLPPLEAENAVPADGLAGQGLLNLPGQTVTAGPSSVATAPAAMTSAPFQQPHPGSQGHPHPSLPPPPPLASRLQPSLPSASAQRHIAEARQAIDASIANLLDSQLQSRAVLMHSNMRAISGQQRDLGKAVVGLRKANDDLAHLVHETLGPLKEVGNVQNWTEMQFQGLLGIEETLRLVREKRERRERAEAERQARREARRAARLEAGEDPDGDDESDGSSYYSGSYSSSYFTGSSRSGSRSRSHSRSRNGSPDRSKSAPEPQSSVSQSNKGKGKAKIEDIVENVRAISSATNRRKEIKDTTDQEKKKLSGQTDVIPAILRTETPDKGKGKEIAAEGSIQSTAKDDDLPKTEPEERQKPADVVETVVKPLSEAPGEPKGEPATDVEESGPPPAAQEESPKEEEEVRPEVAVDAEQKVDEQPGEASISLENPAETDIATENDQKQAEDTVPHAADRSIEAELHEEDTVASNTNTALTAEVPLVDEEQPEKAEEQKPHTVEATPENVVDKETGTTAREIVDPLPESGIEEKEKDTSAAPNDITGLSNITTEIDAHQQAACSDERTPEAAATSNIETKEDERIAAQEDVDLAQEEIAGKNAGRDHDEHTPSDKQTTLEDIPTTDMEALSTPEAKDVQSKEAQEAASEAMEVTESVAKNIIVSEAV
ncbi:hypothetical protein SEUCBS139899_007346 [Sporothrix eucalyptigena]